MAERRPILVVEDDDDVRESLVAVLVMEGFEAVASASAEDALARLRAGLRPAVILLDLMMPGMNGWEFIEAQRSQPELADIPVVVVSAYGSGDGVKTAGAAEYLRKPVDIDTLLELVARYSPRAEVTGDA